jgi:hypothetical protein
MTLAAQKKLRAHAGVALALAALAITATTGPRYGGQALPSYGDNLTGTAGEAAISLRSGDPRVADRTAGTDTRCANVRFCLSAPR